MTWDVGSGSFVATSASSTLSFASDIVSPCGPALANVSVTETVATGAQCKDYGWQSMLNPSTLAPFKNQGGCVSYYASSGAVPIGN